MEHHRMDIAMVTVSYFIHIIFIYDAKVEINSNKTNDYINNIIIEFNFIHY